EAAAEIEAREGDAVGAQRPHQLGKAAEGEAVGLELRQLRAEMYGKALEGDAGQRGGAPREMLDEAEIDAELGLLGAGRDLGVGARIDIGVDAQRDRRPDAKITTG